jgi:4-hydroxy-tetrahydrodipicolinate synthase
MPLFHGLSAFPITPSDASGIVDTGALATLLARIQAAGADSIGLLGSTGGYAFLSRDQRRRAVETAMSAVGGKIPVIVGVGALRTDEAQALAKDARELGADGLLLAPVSYTPLTDDEVYEHFAAVADVGQLPLCIYNNPGTTKFTFSVELIARLSRLGTVKAVKMPLPANGDIAAEIASLRSVIPDNFAVGYMRCWRVPMAGIAWREACCPPRP